ncbi:hypothetical protein GCM10028793_40690 [Nocardiopsis oceani]
MRLLEAYKRQLRTARVPTAGLRNTRVSHPTRAPGPARAQTPEACRGVSGWFQKVVSCSVFPQQPSTPVSKDHYGRRPPLKSQALGSVPPWETIQGEFADSPHTGPPVPLTFFSNV